MKLSDGEREKKKRKQKKKEGKEKEEIVGVLGDSQIFRT